MNKEIKITPPEGYEIDKENSTFDCIKFKPIEKKWRNDITKKLIGYFIDDCSKIITVDDKAYVFNIPGNYNIFATKKQAKSALAMARISQIMANDKRFGGVVTDEEWNDSSIYKYVIERYRANGYSTYYTNTYQFLAFHTPEQRDLFFEENKDLVKDYLMID